MPGKQIEVNYGIMVWPGSEPLLRSIDQNTYLDNSNISHIIRGCVCVCEIVLESNQEHRGPLLEALIAAERDRIQMKKRKIKLMTYSIGAFARCHAIMST